MSHPLAPPYPEWVKAQNHSYRVSETWRLVAAVSGEKVVISPDVKNFKAAKWWLASGLAVQAQMDSYARDTLFTFLGTVPVSEDG
jgi:hypothetical protein